ncbi:cell wall hydrolase [Sphingomonas sp.]|uniref:cell wall hydrolase n=1 Tax=Sphingomonas sp. TaxID=28214 RepID=UPI003B00AC88
MIDPAANTTVIPAKAGTHLPPVDRHESAAGAPGLRHDGRRWLTAILVLVALLAVAVPALLLRYGPTVNPTPRHRAVALPPRRVVPPAEIPPVEPMAYVALPPDDARTFNAGVPFSTLPNPAARPFRFAGGTQDRARAVDCLAAGVLYEAGDDAVGERAVAQVVLNRARHPAFPKSVCGVVFQGSERSTGCQFSFTCDNAMNRWRPSEAAWTRARQVASSAISGSVYAPVGYATHYHTDWVVPYWQSSLDKIAKVGTHLFFRWSGWWGTPRAFERGQSGGEPVIAALSALSPAHAVADTAAVTDPALLPTAIAEATGPAAPPSDPDTFILDLNPGTSPDSWPQFALTVCGARPRCVFMGWTNHAMMPRGGDPSPAQSEAMAFSYLRNREAGLERTLWNCTTHPRPVRNQCMKRQVLRLPPAAPAAVSTPTPGASPLAGVRRRSEAPMPSATPTPPRTSPAATP